MRWMLTCGHAAKKTRSPALAKPTGPGGGPTTNRWAIGEHTPVQSLGYQAAPPRSATTAWSSVSIGPSNIFWNDAMAVHTFGVPLQFAPAVSGYTTPGVQPVLSQMRWAYARPSRAARTIACSLERQRSAPVVGSYAVTCGPSCPVVAFRLTSTTPSVTTNPATAAPFRFVVPMSRLPSIVSVAVHVVAPQPAAGSDTMRSVRVLPIVS